MNVTSRTLLEILTTPSTHLPATNITHFADTTLTPDRLQTDTENEGGVSLLWIPYVLLALVIILLFFASFYHYHWQLKMRRLEKLEPPKTEKVATQNKVIQGIFRFKKAGAAKPKTETTKKAGLTLLSKMKAKKGDDAAPDTSDPVAPADGMSFLDRLKAQRAKEESQASSAGDSKKPMSFLDKVKAQKAKEETDGNTAEQLKNPDATSDTNRIKTASVDGAKKQLSFLDKKENEREWFNDQKTESNSCSDELSVFEKLKAQKTRDREGVSAEGNTKCEEQLPDEIESSGDRNDGVVSVTVEPMSCDSVLAKEQSKTTSPCGQPENVQATGENDAQDVEKTKEITKFEPIMEGRMSDLSLSREDTMPPDNGNSSSENEVALRERRKKRVAKRRAVHGSSRESSREKLLESSSSDRSTPDLPPMAESGTGSNTSSPLPPITGLGARRMSSRKTSLQSLFDIQECGINGVPNRDTSFRFPPVKHRRSLVEID